MLVSRLVRLRLIHSAEIRELENEMIVSMRDYCKILYSVVFVLGMEYVCDDFFYVCLTN